LVSADELQIPVLRQAFSVACYFTVKVLNTIRQTVFWMTIVFIVLSVFVLTLGQSLPIEFKDSKLQSDYYYFVFTALPFSFLLTLIGTIRKKNIKARNWTIGVFTVLAAGLCFFLLVSCQVDNVLFNIITVR